MAERKDNMTVDWDKYLDQTVQLLKTKDELDDALARINSLEAEKKHLSNENSKLEGQLSEMKEWKQAFNNLLTLFNQQNRELVKTHRIIDDCKKWMSAMKEKK